jgi:hypothetical protein
MLTCSILQEELEAVSHICGHKHVRVQCYHQVASDWRQHSALATPLTQACSSAASSQDKAQTLCKQAGSIAYHGLEGPCTGEDVGL